MASARPLIVCSVASISTSRPAWRKVLVVTGPIDAITVSFNSEISLSRKPSRLLTVEELVKVAISIVAVWHNVRIRCAESAGVTVLYATTSSTF
mgnify:CR=1 FL=1